MLADERDHRMFARIVNGMIAHQGSVHSSESSQSETDQIIARIMRTQYKALYSEPSSTDDSEIFSYDDQTELTHNLHRDHLVHQNGDKDDQLPDANFIINM
jgi:hypothetical protein